MAAGGGLLFAPVNMAAFKYTPAHLRGAAVGLLSLLRTEGGSVGTSLAGNIQVRRDQFHLSRLGENLGPLNTHVQSFMDQGQGLYMQWTGDPVRSEQMSLQVLSNLRQQQALSLAFFDIFWLCAVLAAALVVLVLLMKRSVAEKGEHVSAH
jgi:DHA2 family multidrug resistance protein